MFLGTVTWEKSNFADAYHTDAQTELCGRSTAVLQQEEQMALAEEN